MARGILTTQAQTVTIILAFVQEPGAPLVTTKINRECCLVETEASWQHARPRSLDSVLGDDGVPGAIPGESV
jgi:hypothetical protein